jgi:hypothetical protein
MQGKEEGVGSSPDTEFRATASGEAPVDEIPTEICDGDYKFVCTLASGGQGTVCVFEDVKT